MHSETQRYQVRDAAGERKPIEILSGVDYGRLKSFTPSRRGVTTVADVGGYSVPERAGW